MMSNQRKNDDKKQPKTTPPSTPLKSKPLHAQQTPPSGTTQNRLLKQGAVDNLNALAAQGTKDQRVEVDPTKHQPTPGASPQRGRGASGSASHKPLTPSKNTPTKKTPSSPAASSGVINLPFTTQPDSLALPRRFEYLASPETAGRAAKQHWLKHRDKRYRDYAPETNEEGRRTKPRLPLRVPAALAARLPTVSGRPVRVPMPTVITEDQHKELLKQPQTLDEVVKQRDTYDRAYVELLAYIKQTEADLQEQRQANLDNIEKIGNHAVEKAVRVNEAATMQLVQYQSNVEDRTAYDVADLANANAYRIADNAIRFAYEQGRLQGRKEAAAAASAAAGSATQLVSVPSTSGAASGIVEFEDSDPPSVHDRSADVEYINIGEQQVKRVRSDEQDDDSRTSKKAKVQRLQCAVCGRLITDVAQHYRDFHNPIDPAVAALFEEQDMSFVPNDQQQGDAQNSDDAWATFADIAGMLDNNGNGMQRLIDGIPNSNRAWMVPTRQQYLDAMQRAQDEDEFE